MPLKVPYNIHHKHPPKILPSNNSYNYVFLNRGCGINPHRLQLQFINKIKLHNKNLNINHHHNQNT